MAWTYSSHAQTPGRQWLATGAIALLAACGGQSALPDAGAATDAAASDAEAAVGPRQECASDTQCPDDYRCYQAVADKPGLCLLPCEVQSPDCPTAEYCQPKQVNEAYCAVTPAHGERCEFGAPCLEIDDSCLFAAITADDATLVDMCTTECTYAEIGTEANCAAGDLCSFTNIYKIAPSSECASCGTSCTAETEAQTCTDPGSECRASVHVCGIPYALCASPVPLWDGTATTDQTIDDYLCGVLPHTVRWCAPVGSTAVECVPEPSLSPDTGLCIARCGFPNGDLDCGPNAACALPPAGSTLLNEPQEPAVSCSPGDNAPCDTANGYTCSESLAECVRPSRVCVPTAQ